MNTREDYLKALDIDDFLYLRNNNAVKKNAVKCLVIESTLISDSFYNKGDSYNLLEKMLAAIDIEIKDVVILQANDATLPMITMQYKADSILVMGDLIKLNIENIYYTYHPQQIINKPNLKREAWEVLKKLKKCLK